MNKLERKLFSSVLAVLITGCSSGPLPKDQSLLNAEKAYAKAKVDPDVQAYAGPQLFDTEKALKAAALAETEEEMASLAYIASTKNQIALLVTETKKAEKMFLELSERKNKLTTESLQLEQEALERQLLELQAKETARGLMLTLGDVLFIKGKADLQPGAVEPIIQIVEYLKQYPEKTIIIEGHTDNTGSASFNQKLSLQRAEYVQSELLHRGVPAYKMTAIGLGQSQPVASNSTEEGRQKNRRVDIIIQQ